MTINEVLCQTIHTLRKIYQIVIDDHDTLVSRLTRKHVRTEHVDYMLSLRESIRYEAQQQRETEAAWGLLPPPRWPGDNDIDDDPPGSVGGRR